jgi:hypothetical protein
MEYSTVDNKLLQKLNVFSHTMRRNTMCFIWLKYGATLMNSDDVFLSEDEALPVVYWQILRWCGMSTYGLDWYGMFASLGGA